MSSFVPLIRTCFRERWWGRTISSYHALLPESTVGIEGIFPIVCLPAARFMEDIELPCTEGLKRHHQEYDGLTLARWVNKDLRGKEPAGQYLPMQAPVRIVVTLRMHSSASPSPDLRGPGCVPIPGLGA